MEDKSGKIVKSVGKIIVTEMTILVVVAFLTQIGNVAKYILKSKVKLKGN